MAHWENQTWEQLLGPFASSPVEWVAATAGAWLAHIESHVPTVAGTTIWNDIDGVDLYLGLRLRSAYLYDHVVVPNGSSRSVREIGSGGLYVAIVDAPIPDWHGIAMASPACTQPASRPLSAWATESARRNSAAKWSSARGSYCRRLRRSARLPTF